MTVEEFLFNCGTITRFPTVYLLPVPGGLSEFIQIPSWRD